MSDADQENKRPGPGRPTLFREKYIEMAFKLALLGATDAEMAGIFGVEESTLNNWKHDCPEFMESIKKGKEQADAEVAEKLYHRARGYEHPEDKVFLHEGKPVTVSGTKYYPPDTGAAAFWLKNRQPKLWRDTHDFTTGGEKITPQIVTFAEAIKEPEPSEKGEDVNPE
ncbi:MAG: hypothetical protein A2173_03845 [Planctomycetes bacterium RBG_13_44_8b]|nr:MAG: hypothetical protein A2173_03845 [Planctomycetes bacterium RBG_13_44_8b]